ncbi:MAG: hypothetical protein ABIS59_03340, partial [Candidatus Saccharibacteria bacterium]
GKDKKPASFSTASTSIVDEVPQPRLSYLDRYTALPVKVLVRDVAERKLMLICPQLNADWLSGLPIEQLQRTFRCRMNAHKADSGARVFIVATCDEVAGKFTEVQAMFAALRGETPVIPDQTIVLDAASELVGAMS